MKCLGRWRMGDFVSTKGAIFKLIYTSSLALLRLYRQFTWGLEIEAVAPQLYSKIGAGRIA
jgi:hypothetical protein